MSELMTRDWRWDAVLAKPAFWAVYLGCNVDGIIDERSADGDEVSAASVPFVSSPIDIAEYRRFTQDLFLAQTLWEQRRGLLDAAGGDVDRALEDQRQRDPMIDLFGLAENVRRELEDAKGARPDDRHLTIAIDENVTFVIAFAGGTIGFHLSIGDGSVQLGNLSGHAQVPALRWQEIVALTSLARTGERANFPARYAAQLLIECACVSSRDDRAYVESIVADAAGAAGVIRSDERERFIASRVKTVELEVVPASVDGFGWTHDETLGWVNNSPYSPRNPSSAFAYADRDAWRRIAAHLPSTDRRVV